MLQDLCLVISWNLVLAMVMLEVASHTGLVTFLTNAAEKGAGPETQILGPDFVWGDASNMK